MAGRDILSQLAQLIRPLQVRVANSIARAVVQLVDDSTKLQLVQLGVLPGEDIDDAERFQEYGFASIPLPGAEAVVVFPNGDRGHPLVVAVDDRRYRPTGGAAGEVVVYNNAGAVVRLKADGTIEISGGGAVEATVKGETYRSAEDTMLTLISAALNLLTAGPVTAPAAAAAAAAVTGISAFKTAASSYLSTKLKAE